MKNNEFMGMYIHIPFCVKKCKYCDFLSGSYNSETIKDYQESLINEIILNSYIYGIYGNNTPISTIFIGGGTPSSIDSSYIKNIIETIKTHFTLLPDAEISIEANPGSLTLQKATNYINCGINRLSIGLQTTNPDELKAIGRIHSYEDFITSYNDAISAGFKNINIDLMSALPYQTLSSYEDSLRKVLALKPQHISAYSLILEENTPLYDYINSGHEDVLPDEDTEREMYYLTKKLLAEYGYNRYEISNYAKQGYECKHNLSYWSDISYLGLGLGASSYIKSCNQSPIRYQNISDMKEYINILKYTEFNKNAIGELNETIKNNIYKHFFSILSSLQCDKITLSKNDSIEEYMFLGLRKTKGISISQFTDKFDLNIFDVYGQKLTKYKDINLLTVNDDTISLTDKGLDLSNTIFCDFMM